MVKNRMLQVRVTREQYERVSENANRQGFSSISDFVRFQTLEREWGMEQKITAIHDLLISQEVAKTHKRNGALDVRK